MDPVTGAVVAAVIWLFAAGLGAALIGILGAIIGGFVAPAHSEDDGVFIGGFIGWAVGACWALFAIIMCVIQVVRIVQLLTGTAT